MGKKTSVFAGTTWLALFLGFSISKAQPTQVRTSNADIASAREKLKPLNSEMGPIQPGDWLETHQEDGQTFSQYVRSRPIKPTRKRNVLYVVPLGDFDEKQMEIVDLSTEFLGLYFNCETKQLDSVSLKEIPEKARRVHPTWGVRQIRSTYVLHDLLKPKLPDDALAMLALTSSDLYPADDWNFVFGQASLRDRVGVWSMFRNGDPDADFATVLRRTLRTASHETGHMLSIKHCIAYECNMCGSNHRSESDRRPLHLCPECVAKVWWATKCEPIKRYKTLQEFCEKNGLMPESRFYGKAIESLKSSSR